MFHVMQRDACYCFDIGRGLKLGEILAFPKLTTGRQLLVTTDVLDCRGIRRPVIRRNVALTSFHPCNRLRRAVYRVFSQEPQLLVVPLGDHPAAYQLVGKYNQRIPVQPVLFFILGTIPKGAADQSAPVMAVAIGLGFDQQREGLLPHRAYGIARRDVHGYGIHTVDDQAVKAVADASQTDILHVG